MSTAVYDKTDKGREEIATRVHHLAPRLRTLLVLIDGRHNVADLLAKVAGLGLNEQNLAELLEGGFIRDAAAAAPPAPSAPSPASAPAAPSPAPTAAAVLPEGESQFEAIYHFYNETIKNTLGLRGYGLQLKVEKAGSIEDFRELRRAYLEAVQKSRGTEMARSLRERLDQLLYLGETPPPSTTIIGTPGSAQ